VALVVSTVLAIGVGALVTNAAMKRFSAARQPDHDEESH